MYEKLENLTNVLPIFERMYDIVRIVDPLTKKTVNYNNGEITISNNNCYCFWNNEGSCSNCASMRAYNESDTVIKIDYNKEKIYMVMATPIASEEHKYVIELFKDISNTGIIEDINNKTKEEIQNIVNEMNNVVIKDELTCIYNRKFINDTLPAEIVKSISSKKPLSIIMADIDFFKSINDNYGHLAGDCTLFEFTSLIQSVIQDKGWIGRYGGEEFIIVLNDTDSDSAFKIAEKVRKELEKKKFKYEQNKIDITASFGIYTLDNFDLNFNYKQMIDYADKKLYEAKRSGRNKCLR